MRVPRVEGTPGFWLLSCLVFISNALLSASRDQWLLAVLQSTSGIAAALAAARAEPKRPLHERSSD
jgi:hypothetical protein